MTPERWAQVEHVYHAALECDSNTRAAFVAEACAGDDALRREVESLLAQASSASRFMSTPAAARAGELLGDGASLMGRVIGPYAIQARLGVGGMGEVYRARDTKLGRDVAMKILPKVFTSDPDRLSRFEREARVLASFNHPHIGAIYGLESIDGMPALVLELVDGDTLAERIAKGKRLRAEDGGLAIAEVLTIGKQIAEALEAAHERGIVHRDLKPANIKITPAGVVKVLDFGLAKAAADTSRPDLTQSPTLTVGGTRDGAILGTVAYMSPEQARGQAVDKRTDIWAFGCVLYEMFTGKRAFESGDGLSDTLAAVLMTEPDWTVLPATVPPAVVSVLRRCLQKDRQQRMRDIGDVALALEGAFETTAPKTTGTPPLSSPRGQRVGIAALAVALAGMIALAIPAVRHLRETPAPAPPETRTEIVTPATDDPTSFALSPDGRQLVFAASGEGGSRLWLRSLATTTSQPLPGTEGATSPFWSPDSRAIGFFARNALKRIDLRGNTVETLAPVAQGLGGTWNTDGVIVFASYGTGPLMRVQASVGAVVAVTTVAPQQQGHFAPWFLPDGRRFLFSVRGAPDAAGIYLGALDGGAPTRLTSSDSAGVYLPGEGPGPAGAFRAGGWLLWVREGALVTQRLDVAQAALIGERVTLAEGVGIDILGRPAVSVAATGQVAYRTSAGSQRQLSWFDRSGAAHATVGDPDGTLSNPRVAPDGRRVAVSRTIQGNTDIWLLDGARQIHLTFDAANEFFPLWSPDGTKLVFRRSVSADVADLYYKLTSGAGVEEPLVVSDQRKTPTSWSADGRFLLYHSIDPHTAGDLWVAPMVGNRMPSVILKTLAGEGWGRFSPSGRWVAYHSTNKLGPREIYVQPFTEPGAEGSAPAAAAGLRQVSTAGGIYPVWRPDGKELYYLNPSGEMMAVPITIAGSTLEAGVPVALFPTRIVGGGVDNQQGRQYDVAPDGRFLINTMLDDGAAPITFLQNWNPDVKK